MSSPKWTARDFVDITPPQDASLPVWRVKFKHPNEAQYPLYEHRILYFVSSYLEALCSEESLNIRVECRANHYYLPGHFANTLAQALILHDHGLLYPPSHVELDKHDPGQFPAATSISQSVYIPTAPDWTIVSPEGLENYLRFLSGCGRKAATRETSIGSRSPISKVERLPRPALPQRLIDAVQLEAQLHQMRGEFFTPHQVMLSFVR